MRLGQLLVGQAGQRAALVREVGPAVGHRVVGRRRRGVARPVGLDVVHAPAGKHPGVLLVVCGHGAVAGDRARGAEAVAARDFLAVPVVSRVQPQPELQPQGVDVVRDDLQPVVGAFRAGREQVGVDEQLPSRDRMSGRAGLAGAPPVDHTAGHLLGRAGQRRLRAATRIWLRRSGLPGRIQRGVGADDVVPAAVVDHIPVAVGLQARIVQIAGVGFHVGRVVVAAERVPVIPAHGRGAAKAIVQSLAVVQRLGGRGGHGGQDRGETGRQQRGAQQRERPAQAAPPGPGRSPARAGKH